MTKTAHENASVINESSNETANNTISLVEEERSKHENDISQSIDTNLSNKDQVQD